MPIRFFHFLLFFSLLGFAQAEVLPDPIRITLLKAESRHQLRLSNTSAVPVSYKFDFTLENARLEDRSKLLVVVPPKGQADGPALSPADPRKAWNWNYTSYYHFGTQSGTDSKFLYALPFEQGSEFEVIQAFHGTLSHKGKDAYAVDFDLPEGTPVVAARKGLVVFIKEDSDQGGPDASYRELANNVIVAHTDGTLARYVHLQKGGVKVGLGDWVEMGEVLGLSGNTGYSTRPHLHFDVYRPGPNQEVVTIPFQLRVNASPKTPVLGERYRN